MYRPVCASQQSGGSNGLQGDVTWRELAVLLGTDGLSRAVRYAFAEARRLKDACSPLIPFTVLLGSEGIDVADHPGASPHEVMQSVKALLARELPQGMPSFMMVWCTATVHRAMRLCANAPIGAMRMRFWWRSRITAAAGAWYLMNRLLCWAPQGSFVRAPHR